MRLILALITSLPWTIQATQIPFRTGSVAADDLGTGSTADSTWTDFDAAPRADATGHLIFDTVNSLLQHWPNTRYRNGHNIIPGTVPLGTLLYHGSTSSSPPSVPEWTATDPEHSYHFCSGPHRDTTNGCWQLTFVANRPLKVLYFDGSSAANMKDGTMDAQDLLVWGKVDPSRWLDERGRIADLCAWGQEFGIEGYVRMEMDFEVMLCDFAAGVELFSADLLDPWWPPRPPSKSNTELPASADLLRFEMVQAGSWHNHYPGETRIVLDLSRLVSFYDTALVPSLIPHRANRERWDHRPQNISAADLAAVNARLRAVLGTGTDDQPSGVDWKTLYRVVVERYAERLELLQYLLNTTTADNLGGRAKTIQAQLRVMLTPYALRAARPSVVDGLSTRDPYPYAWAAPVWHGCATRHTTHIHASGVGARLTESERLLLGALDETNREICRVVVRMWAAGVHAGLDPLIHAENDLSKTTYRDVLGSWRTDTQALVAWLDWSVWVKCRPACGVEEMCYLPTWPYFWGSKKWQEDNGDTGEEDEDTEDEVWKRPQPRCIRRFEPYSAL